MGGFDKKEGKPRPAKYTHSDKIIERFTFQDSKKCKYCGELIIWLKNSKSKWAANPDGFAHSRTCTVLTKRTISSSTEK